MSNWYFWLELLGRSSALLLAGEIFRRLSRGQPARHRHTLVVSVLLLLAVFPTLVVVLPEWQLALPASANTPKAIVTAQELSRQVHSLPSQHSADWPLWIWLTGFTISLTPVILGALWARKTARRALPFEVCPQYKGAEILVSAEISLPVTCGVWRPRILLPKGAETWSASRLQAVLLHEAAHVRRHDVATQIAAHVLAALWWFQPLVWALRRSLRAESELACDAEALSSGFRASDYATELLAIAKSAGHDYRLAGCSISMARRSGLEQRVRAILFPHSVLFSPRRMLSVLTTLAAIAAAASALSISSDQSFSEQGGSIMKRTLITGLLTSTGLYAATVTGTIHDAGGEAVPGATVSVLNPDTGSKQETTSNAEGKFVISGEGAGQYILRIEKPGFGSLLREFDLNAEANMERQFTLTAEGAPPVADEGAPVNSTSSKPVHVRGTVAQNNLTRKVQPVYPSAAKTDHIQGAVQIEAIISKDGVPTELRIVSSPGADLSESALEAVRQWRYRPTLLNGEPVEIVTMILVNYTLTS